MKRPVSFKFSLLVSAFGMMALAGCDTSNLADKITGAEGRKEQLVDGPRRAPLLNPQMAAPALPPAAQPVQNNAGAPAAAKPAADNPFDQYDEDGNVVASKPAKPLEMNGGEEAGSVDSSFFDRFVPSRSETKNAADAPAEKPVRKSFGRKAQPVAPVFEPAPLAAPSPQAEAAPAEAPQQEPKVAPGMVASEPQPSPVTESQPETIAAPVVTPAAFRPIVAETTPPDSVTGFVPLVPAAKSASAPAWVRHQANAAQPEQQPTKEPARSADSDGQQQAESAADAPASKPSFFARLASSLTGEPKTSEEPVAEPFPELSEVPPPPAAFKQAKENHELQVKTLQEDHATAQQQKQQLDREPSVTAPVPAPAQLEEELPRDEPRSPVAAAPDFKPAPHPASAPVKPSTTVLLGRMHDGQPANNDDMATPSPQPASQPADEPAQETASPWWKRLGLNANDNQPASEAAMREELPQKPQPASESQDRSVAPFVPLSPQPASAQPLNDAQPQDEQESKKDESSAPAAAPAPLASPDKLRDTKTLPPSRYSPPRERQYYLVP